MRILEMFSKDNLRLENNTLHMCSSQTRDVTERFSNTLKTMNILSWIPQACFQYCLYKTP